MVVILSISLNRAVSAFKVLTDAYYEHLDLGSATWRLTKIAVKTLKRTDSSRGVNYKIDSTCDH